MFNLDLSVCWVTFRSALPCASYAGALISCGFCIIFASSTLVGDKLIVLHACIWSDRPLRPNLKLFCFLVAKWENGNCIRVIIRNSIQKDEQTVLQTVVNCSIAARAPLHQLKQRLHLPADPPFKLKPPMNSINQHKKFKKTIIIYYIIIIVLHCCIAALVLSCLVDARNASYESYLACTSLPSPLRCFLPASHASEALFAELLPAAM